MKTKLATVAACALACACGASAPVSKPIPLATPDTTAQTSASRKDVLCKSTDLVALEPPLLSRSTSNADSGPVRSVSVRDVEDRAVDVAAEVISPVKVGAPLDVEAAREVSRRLWRSGKYDDVALETTRANDAVDVVFRVIARRKIANVFADGDATSEEVATSLHLAPGALYDPVAMVSARRALVESYVKRGHRDATITVSSGFASPDHRTIDVCIRAERGPIIALDGVEIRGSAYSAALEGVFAREDSHNVRGSPIDEDMLARDELVMAAWLFDQGLLAHNIEKKIERRGDAMHVTFEITDGPVYHYGKFEVKGDLLMPKADYMKLIALKRGDVFNRTAVMAVLDAIRGVHKSAGHDQAEIEPLTNLDPANGTVDVVISIDDAKARSTTPTPAGASTSRFSMIELAPGHGRAAKSGDTVSVHYKGMLTDGTVFDTSVGRAPFQFELGKGAVISGFNRGVTGLKIGGKRRVTIPPELAYGSRGAPPTIPSNATLVFEIELVAIQ